MLVINRIGVIEKSCHNNILYLLEVKCKVYLQIFIELLPWVGAYARYCFLVRKKKLVSNHSRGEAMKKPMCALTLS